jgi:hypothetical protein
MHDTPLHTSSGALLKQKPWGLFLNAVNSKLAEPVTLHCLGGFVLTAIHNIPRATGDLDYIEVVPKEAAGALEDIAGKNSLLAKRHGLCIHFAGVIDLPDNYEDRLSEAGFGLEKLRLLVPEVYDLFLSKLVRNSPKDRDDVKFLAKKLALKFAVLEQRFNDEMKPWLPNIDRHERTLNLWKEFF